MPKYTEGDLVKKVEELCMSNSFDTKIRIREAMRKNNDKTLICVVADEEAWQERGDADIAFYAFSDNYVYFLEHIIEPYAVGESHLNVVSVPKNPDHDDPIIFGGWS